MFTQLITLVDSVPRNLGKVLFNPIIAYTSRFHLTKRHFQLCWRLDHTSDTQNLL